MNRSDLQLVALWGLLLLITLISLETGYVKSWMSDERLRDGVVIILAFVKVRLIILDFMEVRNARLGLRVALEVWVVGLCAALIGLLFYDA